MDEFQKLFFETTEDMLLWVCMKEERSLWVVLLGISSRWVPKPFVTNGLKKPGFPWGYFSSTYRVTLGFLGGPPWWDIDRWVKKYLDNLYLYRFT